MICSYIGLVLELGSLSYSFEELESLVNQKYIFIMKHL